jgi:hypothetical protein
MRKIHYFWTATLLLTLLFVAADRAVFAEDEYPGVFAGENCLVFVQGSDQSGGLSGLVVLTYEYSMDWVISTAKTGKKTESGLSLSDGHQYVYNADGSRRSQSDFTNLNLDLKWGDLKFTVMPSYGHFLAPMVHGGLAYAFVEVTSGLPSQIALAANSHENGETINLFEGFLYQFSQNTLSAQIAFTEVAFGTQGMVRGNFPDNFPPPPEDTPIPYPDYTQPDYPTPGGDTPPSFPAADPTMPMGKIVSPDAAGDKPRFTLEPVHDYDVPPIIKIGVVATQSSTDFQSYGPVVDQYFQDTLANMDGIEVVYIPWDSSKFGGAVKFDRAAWLCKEYGVDALLMSDLSKIDVPGGGTTGHLSQTAYVTTKMKSTLIEGAGGSEWWSKESEQSEMHNYYEIEENQDAVIRNDLNKLVMSLINDLAGGSKLQGGHVD